MPIIKLGTYESRRNENTTYNIEITRETDKAIELKIEDTLDLFGDGLDVDTVTRHVWVPKSQIEHQEDGYLILAGWIIAKEAIPHLKLRWPEGSTEPLLPEPIKALELYKAGKMVPASW